MMTDPFNASEIEGLRFDGIRITGRFPVIAEFRLRDETYKMDVTGMSAFQVKEVSVIIGAVEFDTAERVTA